MRHKLSFLILPLVLMMAGPAAAADYTVLGTIPSMFSIFILIGALACLSIGLKLFSLVKGGAMAKGYQLWIISFITLAASQILVLLEKVEILALTFDFSAVLLAATVILWFVGLIQARKVLG